MKIKIGNKSIFFPNILIILFLGLLLRIILAPLGTLKLDQNTFIAWSSNLARNGFKNFYSDWSDYLPGYMYFLWFLGKIKGIIPDILLYKFPAIFSDLFTGFLIYKIAKKYVNEKKSILLSSLFLFNPAILGNSTLWGQIDSLVCLFSVLTIWLLEKNLLLSAICLSLGTLIKPQTAFLTPLILYLLIVKKTKIKNIFIYAISGALIFILGFLPFAPKELNIFNFIYERLVFSSNQYPYTSINAFNFWGLFGFWKTDIKNIPLNIVGTLIFASVCIFSVLKGKLIKGKEYVLSALIFLASFLFLTRIHERHLLPIFPFVLLSTIFLPNTIVIYFLLSLTYVFNLYYSFIWITHDFKVVYSHFFIYLLISINLFSLFFFVKKILSKKTINYVQFFKNLWIKTKKIKVAESKDIFSKIKINSRLSKLILVGVLAFSLITRIYGLGNPKNEYFDEVYHAFTARQMLHGNSAAWEWWNTPPEGFAYEWTHPPLAKLFMWGSMTVFGENSFSWRLPGVLLGVGTVLLVYLIAKVLFRDEILALISAGVFSLDGLALTMSRIGMNDVYLLFFTLLTIFFFLKNRDFLSSISLGLAISSKWSAVWLVPILFVIWLSRKKRVNLKLSWFLIIPLLVYLTSYIPMFLTNHSLDIFWGMQKQMWWYHTRLQATHPYTSSWWSWPLNLRPVYLYTSNEVGGMVSRIYNLGNPVVFWFGLISVVCSFIYSFLNKNRKLALVVFSYLVFFVPWAASPRIMFFYHYLPSIPFLSIATGYVLRKEKKLIISTLTLFLIVFLYFYPHWTGIKIPLWLDKSYYWFSSWR